MVDTPGTIELTCCVTGAAIEAEAGKSKDFVLPRGWKQLGNQVYSPAGWQQAFALRTIYLPIASVAEGYDDLNWSPDACKKAWSELRTAARLSGQQARAVANWALVEYAVSDREPLEQTAKGLRLPRWAGPDRKALYAMARQRWPELDSQSLDLVIRAARASYVAGRWNRRILGTATLPEFARDTIPLPIASKDFRLHDNEEGGIFARARLAGKRFTLRIRTAGRARQTSALKMVIAGQAAQGESEIVVRKNGDMRVAITIWLPMRKSHRKDRTLTVRTGETQLWLATLDGKDEPWNLHEDWVLRSIMAHKRRLQRLSDDIKFERRRPRQAGQHIAEYRERICGKQHRRVDDFIERASAFLLGFVRRNHVAAVEYEDKDHWLGGFPYFKLRTRVEQKLREIGVTFKLLEGSTDEA